MFLPDHFLKWALSAILAANVAEAKREMYAFEDDEEEEEQLEDAQSTDSIPVRRKTRHSSGRT